MTDKQQMFSWRGWTTFVITISFIVDTISGIILYIAPPGRIANWTNWTIWGLDKDEWAAIHTIFGYLLLIIAGVHLYYNWKMFMNFIWNKIRKALNRRWELITATLLCLFVFLGTLWNIPPFSNTMSIGQTLKDSWAESKVEVPIVHAELMSLSDFAEKIQVPPDELLSSLNSKGYTVQNTEQTLGEIAEQNNTSPDKLYEAMKSGEIQPTLPKTIEGSGLGRKTLEAISAEQGLSIDEVLSRLKQKGIRAQPGDRLKDVAEEHEKSALEIHNIITGQEE
jgi:hypothetical protein